MQKVNRKFPWGICIGTLSDKDSRQRLHAILPTITGGVRLEYTSECENLAVTVLETAALSLFDVLSYQMLEAHIIDFSIKKRFAYLSKLKHTGQYKLYINVYQVEKLLAYLNETARYRYHELLDNSIENIQEYNQSKCMPVCYIVVIINLDDLIVNNKTVQEWLKLFKSAMDAGIYFILYREQPKENNITDNLYENLPYPAVCIGKKQNSITVNVKAGKCELTHNWLNKIIGSSIHVDAPENLDQIINNQLYLAQRHDKNHNYFLSVPVGYSMDGRSKIALRMGEPNDCYNAFIVGMAGTGKTSFINNLLLNIAEHYDSSQLRLYLMDYKEGVEFNVFDGHPNCEKIFLDNRDIAAATELLESFSATITERAALFRSVDVRHIDEWNQLVSHHPNMGRTMLPRLLLVADEVQRLLSDDRSGRYFAELLRDVVRRGRSLGIHIILSTQTLIGNMNIDRTLMSQIAMRIAFKLNSAADCEKILDMGNHAPMHLDKYQFILNQNSGFREANIRVQALPAPSTQEIRRRLAEIAAQRSPDKKIVPLIMRADVMPKQTEQIAIPLQPKSGEVIDMPLLTTEYLTKGRVSELPESEV